MDDMLDIMQEMLEEGFTQEQAQFIAADRCFGNIVNCTPLSRQI